MSWDGYTDNLMAQGLEKACIFGMDGALWAQSKNMSVQPEECAAIVKGFSDSTAIRANGLRINGEKYFFLQSDDAQMQGKKGKGGITIAKSNKCVVCAIYGDSVAPGTARTAVEKMKDYLVGQNY